MSQNDLPRQNVALLVLVAALGYFVDIYDLIIFSIVRVKSFSDIGIPESQMRVLGEYVLNMQMAGLLLGGILWGVIGDKYGRVKVLFGSIVMYSLANIANGLVTEIHTYAAIRFIAGIGLAGELGAGITLISETMSKNKRGYGTMLVAGIGVLGALAAALVAQKYSWRTSYFVGGALGLLLLLLRVGTFESKLFRQTSGTGISQGSFRLLFKNKQRFLRYLYCICIGLPIWFVVGIFVTQAPEFGKALKSVEPLSAAKGIMFTYLGISIGDVFAGLLAQLTRSRRLTVFCFQVLILVSSLLYLNSTGMDTATFSWLCFFMGFSVGYWATFVTISAEQFGTNIRATVTTTAPNFVRGALIPCTLLFEFFVGKFGLIPSSYIMILLLTAIAVFSLTRLKESFNKDLDYIEM